MSGTPVNCDALAAAEHALSFRLPRRCSCCILAARLSEWFSFTASNYNIFRFKVSVPPRCCDNTLTTKQPKGKGAHFSSQFKVQSVMASCTIKLQIKAAGTWSTCSHHICVRKLRVMLLLLASSLSPHIQSRTPARGMVPPTMGESSHLHYCNQEIPHRHAQRPISPVILESVNLTINANANCHDFTPCQLDSQTHYF